VLKKLVFSPRTERLQVTPAERFQGHLFLAPLIAQVERLRRERQDATATVEVVREAQEPKRKARRKAFPDHLPRVKTVCQILPEERICCGQPMAAMGSEVTREQERVEMSIVHEIVRQKYYCRKCQEHVKVAPGPERVIEKGILGNGVLSHVIAERFGNHMPYHRLERKSASEGIEISRTVRCRSALECAERLEPVWRALRERIVDFLAGCRGLRSYAPRADSGSCATAWRAGRSSPQRSRSACSRGSRTPPSAGRCGFVRPC
jgi:transposase